MRFLLTLCVTIAVAYPMGLFAEKSPTNLAGKIPDSIPAPLTKNPDKRTQEFFQSMINFARISLESGLPALAQNIAEDGLMKFSPPPQIADELTAICADALLAQGNYELVQKYVATISKDKQSPDNKIRLALASVGMNKPEQAEEFLKDIDPKKISNKSYVWFKLAKGYILYENGKSAEALKEFAIAAKLNKNPYIAADIEIAINLCRLSENFEEKNLPQLADDLAKKVSLYMGTPAGFQFAKQYAVALFKLGKTTEAIEVLDQQLQIELAQEIDKDEIKLLSAALMKDPARQHKLLSEILQTTSSTNIAEFAIALLVRNPDSTSEELLNFLNDILKNGSKKIHDRIYLEIAKLAVKRDDPKAAAENAEALTTKFPASKYKSEALRILTWAAFAENGGKNPEYRLAARYLTELSELETNPTRAQQTMLLAADSYYLNKDYATAAEQYDKLFSKMANKRGLLLNRAIDSFLALGELENAIKMTNKAYSLGGVADDDMWNAEWKIISKYREDGNSQKALDRINRAITSTGKASEILRLRMLWLRAKMTEELGNYPKTVDLADNILSDIEHSKLSDTKALDIIGANTMLMKARSLEKMDKFDDKYGAFESYEKLRQKYPTSTAAMQSYLNQARAEASLGHYQKAQRLCLSLAELKPQSNYAYTALFDSAMYARQIGLDSSYKSALATLDKLCNDFPDDSRNFYARIAQAEILRMLNVFADARKLYNGIINKYSTHPEIYLAWLGLADSTLAQKDRASDAVAIYERLYSLPEMPDDAKAEAAFKWGFALERANRVRDAKEVWWITSSNLLSKAKTGATGRYWIARSLYSLAKELEKSGMLRDARAAYEVIVKNKLPAADIAEKKLLNKGEK